MDFTRNETRASMPVAPKGRVQFTVRRLLVVVMVIAIALALARSNRGNVGMGWSPISEGDLSRSSEFFESARDALDSWLRKRNYEPTDSPERKHFTSPDARCYVRNPPGGTKTYVHVLQEGQHFYVHVEFHETVWPYQSCQREEQECETIAGAISDWWRRYKDDN